MSISSEFDTVPASAETRLRRICAHPDAVKARAHVTDARGETLLSFGETNLPVALSGVTKLFTLAMILREFDRGAMTPETPIADLLPQDTIKGLCVIDGTDHSDAITVDHLIGHHSGISDYFAPPGRNILSLKAQSDAEDRAWSPEQALEISRHYGGRFVPGAPGKVNYSRTNYLLLGEILQESTGMPFDQLVNLRLVSSLGLRDTYVFTPRHFDRYFSITPILRGGVALRAPRTLASFGPAGSVVSTPRDMTRFLRGFWSGEFFGQRWQEDLLANPRRLSRGVQLSRGVMITRGATKHSTLIGHTGSSGTAALIDTASGTVGFLATNAAGDNSRELTDFSAVIAKLGARTSA